ncbi:MAG: alkaline phosphatase PhoX [Actinomycetota bacterium]
MRSRAVATFVALAIVVAVAASAAAFKTPVEPYAKPVGSTYEIEPLLSVGDRVPELGAAGEEYQMIGNPDGLGARRSGDRVEVFSNHELPKPTQSEPRVGRPLARGAFVSRWLLRENGSVVGGELAYDNVFAEDTLIGPAPDASNTTPAFGSFCSGFLATGRVGFSQPVYLTGEESTGSDTFDGRGGLSVAVFGNELHTLPKLGRFAKENGVVMPETGKRTVIFPMEDGPSTADSQLWMYVGRKRRHVDTVLGRNGLDNGRLFVFVASGHTSEADFRTGTLNGHWVEIPNAEEKTDAELETAADAAGAFGFIRPEDGAASKTEEGIYYFVTTGGGTGNRLGRGYRLDLHPGNPTRAAQLKVIYNADRIVAAGGDVAISPDNVDTSRRYLMVQEDGTANSRPVMGRRGRDGSIWRFDLAHGFARRRVAQLDPPGRDGAAVGPGIWETSGIISTSRLFGRGSWLFDVQAQSPTAAPAPNTVEDGQLLLMRRTN